jgi:ribosomal protein S14
MSAEFHALRVSRIAARKVATENEIIRLWCIRFPHDPLTAGLKADTISLDQAKEAQRNYTRCDDFAECRAEVKT